MYDKEVWQDTEQSIITMCRARELHENGAAWTRVADPDPEFEEEEKNRIRFGLSTQVSNLTKIKVIIANSMKI